MWLTGSDGDVAQLLESRPIGQQISSAAAVAIERPPELLPVAVSYKALHGMTRAHQIALARADEACAECGFKRTSSYHNIVANMTVRV